MTIHFKRFIAYQDLNHKKHVGSIKLKTLIFHLETELMWFLTLHHVHWQLRYKLETYQTSKGAPVEGGPHKGA